jgi:hypothetical protein
MLVLMGLVLSKTLDLELQFKSNDNMFHLSFVYIVWFIWINLAIQIFTHLLLVFCIKTFL